MTHQKTPFLMAVVVAICGLIWAQIAAPTHLKPLTNHLFDYPRPGDPVSPLPLLVKAKLATLAPQIPSINKVGDSDKGRIARNQAARGGYAGGGSGKNSDKEKNPQSAAAKAQIARETAASAAKPSTTGKNSGQSADYIAIHGDCIGCIGYQYKNAKGEVTGIAGYTKDKNGEYRILAIEDTRNAAREYADAVAKLIPTDEKNVEKRLRDAGVVGKQEIEQVKATQQASLDFQAKIQNFLSPTATIPNVIGCSGAICEAENLRSYLKNLNVAEPDIAKLVVERKDNLVKWEKDLKTVAEFADLNVADSVLATKVCGSDFRCEERFNRETYLSELNYKELADSAKKQLAANKMIVKFQTTSNEELGKEYCQGSADSCDRLINEGGLLKSAGVDEKTAATLTKQKQATNFAKIIESNQLGTTPGQTVDYQATYKKAFQECQFGYHGGNESGCKDIANSAVETAKSKIQPIDYIALSAKNIGNCNKYTTESGKANCLSQVKAKTDAAVAKSTYGAINVTSVENKNIVAGCIALGGTDCSSRTASLDSIGTLSGNPELDAAKIEANKAHVYANTKAHAAVAYTLQNQDPAKYDRLAADPSTDWVGVETALNNLGTSAQIVMDWNNFTAGRFKRGNDLLLEGYAQTAEGWNEGNALKVLVGTSTSLRGGVIQGGDAATVVTAAVAIPAAPLLGLGGSAILGTGLGVATSTQMIGAATDACQFGTKEACATSLAIASISVVGTGLGVLQGAASIGQASRLAPVTNIAKYEAATVRIGQAINASKGAQVAIAGATFASEAVGGITFSAMAIETCNTPGVSSLDCASSIAMAAASAGKFTSTALGAPKNLYNLTNGVKAVEQTTLTAGATGLQITHSASSALFLASACSKMFEGPANVDTTAMCAMGISGAVQDPLLNKLVTTPKVAAPASPAEALAKAGTEARIANAPELSQLKLIEAKAEVAAVEKLMESGRTPALEKRLQNAQRVVNTMNETVTIKPQNPIEPIPLVKPKTIVERVSEALFGKPKETIKIVDRKIELNEKYKEVVETLGTAQDKTGTKVFDKNGGSILVAETTKTAAGKEVTTFKFNDKITERAGLTDQHLTVLNEVLAEYQGQFEKQLGFDPNLGIRGQQAEYIISGLEAFGKNGTTGSLFGALPGLGKTEVIIPMMNYLHASMTKDTQFILFPDAKLMSPWISIDGTGKNVRNTELITFFENKFGEGSVLILEPGQPLPTEAIIKKARIVVTTRDAAFELQNVETLGGKALREKWAESYKFVDESHKTTNVFELFRRSGATEKISQITEATIFKNAIKSVQEFSAIKEAINARKNGQSLDVSLTSDGKSGEYSSSREARVLTELLAKNRDILPDNLKNRSINEANLVETRNLIDQFVDANYSKTPAHKQFAAELTMVNKLADLLAAVPGKNYGLAKTNGEFSVSPKESSNFTGRTYSSLAEQLLYNTVGVEILKGVGEMGSGIKINVDNLTISRGGSETTYARLMLEGKGFAMFTGTPELMSKLYKIAYGIELKVFSKPAFETLSERFTGINPLGENGVFTGIAEQFNARKSEGKSQVYVFMDKNSNNVATLDKLTSNFREGETVFGVKANGEMIQGVVENGKFKQTKSFNTKAELELAQKEVGIYKKFYEDGAITGVDTPNDVATGRVVGICNGCDQTTISQGIARFRASETGENAPMDIVYLDAPATLKNASKGELFLDLIKSSGANEATNMAIAEVNFKEILLKTSVDLTLERVLAQTQDGFIGSLLDGGLRAKVEAIKQEWKNINEYSWRLENANYTPEQKLAKTLKQVKGIMESLDIAIGKNAGARAEFNSSAGGYKDLAIGFRDTLTVKPLSDKPSLADIVELINNTSGDLKNSAVTFKERGATQETILASAQEAITTPTKAPTLVERIKSWLSPSSPATPDQAGSAPRNNSLALTPTTRADLARSPIITYFNRFIPRSNQTSDTLRAVTDAERELAATQNYYNNELANIGVVLEETETALTAAKDKLADARATHLRAPLSLFTSPTNLGRTLANVLLPPRQPAEPNTPLTTTTEGIRVEENIIDIIEKVESALTPATEERGLGCRGNLCEPAAGLVNVEASKQNLTAKNYNASKLNYARGITPKSNETHEFTVVTDLEGNRFVIDLTFSQFENINQNNSIAKELLINGYFRLTDETLTEYLNLLTKNPNKTIVSLEFLDKQKPNDLLLSDLALSQYLNGQFLSFLVSEYRLPQYIKNIPLELAHIGEKLAAEIKKIKVVTDFEDPNPTPTYSRQQIVSAVAELRHLLYLARKDDSMFSKDVFKLIERYLTPEILNGEYAGLDAEEKIDYLNKYAYADEIIKIIKSIETFGKLNDTENEIAIIKEDPSNYPDLTKTIPGITSVNQTLYIDGVVLDTVEYQGKEYVLHNKRTKLTPEIIKGRLSKISSSLPETIVVIDDGASIYLLVEKINGVYADNLQNEQDIINIVTRLGGVGFIADFVPLGTLNMTNFVVDQNGKVYYVDQDLLDYVVSSETFQETTESKQELDAAIKTFRAINANTIEDSLIPTQLSAQITPKNPMWNDESLTENANRIMDELITEAHKQGMTDAEVDLKISEYLVFMKDVPVISLRDNSTIQRLVNGEDLLSAFQVAGQQDIAVGHTSQSDIDSGLNHYVFGSWARPEGFTSSYGSTIAVIDPSTLQDPTTIVTIHDIARTDEENYKKSAIRGQDFIRIMTLSSILTHQNPLDAIGGQVRSDKNVSEEISDQISQWQNFAEVKIYDQVPNNKIIGFVTNDPSDKSNLQKDIANQSKSTPVYTQNELFGKDFDSPSDVSKMGWNIRRLAKGEFVLDAKQNEYLIYSYQHNLPNNITYANEFTIIAADGYPRIFTLKSAQELNTYINATFLADSDTPQVSVSYIATDGSPQTVIFDRPYTSDDPIHNLQQLGPQAVEQVFTEKSVFFDTPLYRLYVLGKSIESKFRSRLQNNYNQDVNFENEFPKTTLESVPRKTIFGQEDSDDEDYNTHDQVATFEEYVSEYGYPPRTGVNRDFKFMHPFQKDLIELATNTTTPLDESTTPAQDKPSISARIANWLKDHGISLSEQGQIGIPLRLFMDEGGDGGAQVNQQTSQSVSHTIQKLSSKEVSEDAAGSLEKTYTNTAGVKFTTQTAIVADGVSAAPKSALGSRLAVDALLNGRTQGESTLRSLSQILLASITKISRNNELKIAKTLHDEIINNVLSDLNDIFTSSPNTYNTTLTGISVVDFEGQKYYGGLAVGDSPAFLLRENVLYLLTPIGAIPHSYKNLTKPPNHLSYSDIDSSPTSNTQIVSEEKNIPHQLGNTAHPYVFFGKVQPGDVFFVTSDGLIKDIDNVNTLKTYIENSNSASEIIDKATANKQQVKQTDDWSGAMIRIPADQAPPLQTKSSEKGKINLGFIFELFNPRTWVGMGQELILDIKKLFGTNSPTPDPHSSLSKLGITGNLNDDQASFILARTRDKLTQMNIGKLPFNLWHWRSIRQINSQRTQSQIWNGFTYAKLRAQGKIVLARLDADNLGGANEASKKLFGNQLGGDILIQAISHALETVAGLHDAQVVRTNEGDEFLLMGAQNIPGLDAEIDAEVAKVKSLYLEDNQIAYHAASVTHVDDDHKFTVEDAYDANLSAPSRGDLEPRIARLNSFSPQIAQMLTGILANNTNHEQWVSDFEDLFYDPVLGSLVDELRPLCLTCQINFYTHADREIFYTKMKLNGEPTYLVAVDLPGLLKVANKTGYSEGNRLLTSVMSPVFKLLLDKLASGADVNILRNAGQTMIELTQSELARLGGAEALTQTLTTQLIANGYTSSKDVASQVIPGVAIVPVDTSGGIVGLDRAQQALDPLLVRSLIQNQHTEYVTKTASRDAWQQLLDYYDPTDKRGQWRLARLGIAWETMSTDFDARQRILTQGLTNSLKTDEPDENNYLKKYFIFILEKTKIAVATSKGQIIYRWQEDQIPTSLPFSIYLSLPMEAREFFDNEKLDTVSQAYNKEIIEGLEKIKSNINISDQELIDSIKTLIDSIQSKYQLDFWESLVKIIAKINPPHNESLELRDELGVATTFKELIFCSGSVCEHREGVAQKIIQEYGYDTLPTTVTYKTGDSTHAISAVIKDGKFVKLIDFTNQIIADNPAEYNAKYKAKYPLGRDIKDILTSSTGSLLYLRQYQKAVLKPMYLSEYELNTNIIYSSADNFSKPEIRYFSGIIRTSLIKPTPSPELREKAELLANSFAYNSKVKPTAPTLTFPSRPANSGLGAFNNIQGINWFYDRVIEPISVRFYQWIQNNQILRRTNFDIRMHIEYYRHIKSAIKASGKDFGAFNSDREILGSITVFPDIDPRIIPYIKLWVNGENIFNSTDLFGILEIVNQLPPHNPNLNIGIFNRITELVAQGHEGSSLSRKLEDYIQTQNNLEYRQQLPAPNTYLDAEDATSRLWGDIITYAIKARYDQDYNHYFEIYNFKMTYPDEWSSMAQKYPIINQILIDEEQIIYEYEQAIIRAKEAGIYYFGDIENVFRNRTSDLLNNNRKQILTILQPILLDLIYGHISPMSTYSYGSLNPLDNRHILTILAEISDDATFENALKYYLSEINEYSGNQSENRYFSTLRHVYIGSLVGLRQQHDLLVQSIDYSLYKKILTQIPDSHGMKTFWRTVVDNPNLIDYLELIDESPNKEYFVKTITLFPSIDDWIFVLKNQELFQAQAEATFKALTGNTEEDKALIQTLVNDGREIYTNYKIFVSNFVNDTHLPETEQEFIYLDNYLQQIDKSYLKTNYVNLAKHFKIKNWESKPRPQVLQEITNQLKTVQLTPSEYKFQMQLSTISYSIPKEKGESLTKTLKQLSQVSDPQQVADSLEEQYKIISDQYIDQLVALSSTSVEQEIDQLSSSFGLSDTDKSSFTAKLTGIVNANRELSLEEKISNEVRTLDKKPTLANSTLTLFIKSPEFIDLLSSSNTLSNKEFTSKLTEIARQKLPNRDQKTIDQFITTLKGISTRISKVTSLEDRQRILETKKSSIRKLLLSYIPMNIEQLSYIFHELSRLADADSLFNKYTSNTKMTPEEISLFITKIEALITGNLEEFIVLHPNLSEIQTTLESTDLWKDLKQIVANKQVTDQQIESSLSDMTLILTNRTLLDVWQGKVSHTCFGDHPEHLSKRDNVVPVRMLKDGELFGNALFLIQPSTIRGGKIRFILIGFDPSESFASGVKEEKMHEFIDLSMQGFKALADQNNWELMIGEPEEVGGLSNRGLSIQARIMRNYADIETIKIIPETKLQPDYGYTPKTAHPLSRSGIETLKTATTKAKIIPPRSTSPVDLSAETTVQESRPALPALSAVAIGITPSFASHSFSVGLSAWAYNAAQSATHALVPYLAPLIANPNVRAEIIHTMPLLIHNVKTWVNTSLRGVSLPAQAGSQASPPQAVEQVNSFGLVSPPTHDLLVKNPNTLALISSWDIDAQEWLKSGKLDVTWNILFGSTEAERKINRGNIDLEKVIQNFQRNPLAVNRIDGEYIALQRLSNNTDGANSRLLIALENHIPLDQIMLRDQATDEVMSLPAMINSLSPQSETKCRYCIPFTELEKDSETSRYFWSQSIKFKQDTGLEIIDVLSNIIDQKIVNNDHNLVLVDPGSGAGNFGRALYKVMTETETSLETEKLVGDHDLYVELQALASLLKTHDIHVRYIGITDAYKDKELGEQYWSLGSTDDPIDAQVIAYTHTPKQRISKILNSLGVTTVDFVYSSEFYQYLDDRTAINFNEDIISRLSPYGFYATKNIPLESKDKLLTQATVHDLTARVNMLSYLFTGAKNSMQSTDSNSDNIINSLKPTYFFAGMVPIKPLLELGQKIGNLLGGGRTLKYDSEESSTLNQARGMFAGLFGAILWLLIGESAQGMTFTPGQNGTLYDDLMNNLSHIFGNWILNNYNFLRYNLNNLGYGLLMAPLIHIALTEILPIIIKKQIPSSVKKLLWIAIVPLTVLAGVITELMNAPGSDASKLNFDPNDLRAYIYGAGIYWATTLLYSIVEKSGLSIKTIANVIQSLKQADKYKIVINWLNLHLPAVILIPMFFGLIYWIVLQIIKFLGN